MMKWHALVGAAFGWIAASVTAADDRPNILFIVSDDQRADTIAAPGNEHIRTPALDGLVRSGVAFERAYCMGGNSAAVCAPSRAMILSGRTYFRAGPNPFDVPRDLALLPQTLREAGYTTFGTGKWHSGKAAFARCFTDGASIFFGGMGSHTQLQVHDFDPSGEYPDGARRTLREFSSTEFADAVIGFLRRHDASAPFFAYLAFTAPHDPRTPPEGYAYDVGSLPLPPNYLPVHPFDNGELVIRDEKLAPWPRTPEEIRRHLAAYYGMITHMDEQIGRVLGAVADLGLGDSTIVVFCSDQGLAIGSHGLMGKQNLYEHSTRSPVVFAGPGIVPGQLRCEFAYLFDLAPTVCELAGVGPPAGMDGVSLVPALRGRPLTTRATVFTAYRDVQRAVRDDRFKLIRYPKIGRTQLFDLTSDPFETNDLSGHDQHAGEIDRLMGELRAWQQRTGDTLDLSPPDPSPGRFEHQAMDRPAG